MLRTIDYTQLDDDTKAYLREVRNRNGNGSPGVFHGISNGKPILAFLAGLVILPLFVWAGYSSNKPAWANAMLQTAGVLLGGWLMLYAVRRWTAGGDKYVGKFFYFDPEYVYVGEGEQLKFAELDSDTAIEPVGTSALRFENDRSQFVIPLPNRALALYVANYYDALDHVYGNADGQAESDGRWANLSAAEKGAVAKYMVRNDQLPQSLNQVDLDIDRMPEEVRPKRGGGSGFFRYLLILAAGAGVFFAFKTTNAPIHDNASFAAAKGGGPSDLRHYLNDDKNTAHRDEALELLRKQYDAPIQKVREKATDAELKEGFVKLLDSLRGPETPAVSIRVTDTNPAALTKWTLDLRQRFGDGIGDALGKDYVVGIKAPGDPDSNGNSAPADETKMPAHIEVSYSTVDPNRLTWTVELRLSPQDANPYLRTSREYKPQQGMPALIPSEAVYHDVMLKMVGAAPPVPPKLPVDNDW